MLNIPPYDNALKLRNVASRKSFGENNVQTAKHYGNLGRLYQSMRRYEVSNKKKTFFVFSLGFALGSVTHFHGKKERGKYSSSPLPIIFIITISLIFFFFFLSSCQGKEYIYKYIKQLSFGQL